MYPFVFVCLFVCFIVVVVLSHHISEILSKVALNTITITHPFVFFTSQIHKVVFRVPDTERTTKEQTIQQGPIQRGARGALP
jgi:hypothetical protein